MWWTTLAACMGPWPYPLPSTDDDAAVCDGSLQAAEGGVVDGPFDGDGDGYVTGDDPACVRSHAPQLLDCDDAEPAIHPFAAEVSCNSVDDDCNVATPDSSDNDEDGFPSCLDCDDLDPRRTPGAEEVCGDGIDNDCDDEVDGGCPAYAGFFLVEPAVAYSCAFGSVDVVLDQLHLSWDPPDAEFENLSSLQPPLMIGDLALDGAFDVDAVITSGTAASCDEHYRLTGQFTDDDHFTADFSVEFDGAFCGNCVDSSWGALSGTRYGL